MNDPAIRRRAAAVAVASLLPLAAAQAEPTIAELLQRIEAQEQKILVLERRLGIQEDVTKAGTAPAAAPMAIAKAGPKGFSIQSDDSRYQVTLRGTLHYDGRYFVDDVTAETADTWGLRRARPIIEGTISEIYDFRLAPDFAGGRAVIQDAFVNARLHPSAQVTVGKFRVPVGLERLQSANDIRFIERGFPSGLLPNRDLGVSVGGELLRSALNYSVGYFNGVTDGGSSDAIGDVDTDTEGDWAARLYATPFADSDDFALRNLRFGIAGTYVDVSGGPANPLLATYRTPGQQVFFRYRGPTAALPGGATFADGERLRITPQFYYSYGQFGLLGEYARVAQDVTRQAAAGTRSTTLDNSAWQLAAHWFLTGEEQAFRGFRPNTEFSLEKGTWGAFELVARYQELSVDEDAFAGGAESFADPAASARAASAWGLGLNWYLSQNLKWALDYERTSFDGGAAGGTDRGDEEAFLTRVALGF